MLCMSRGSRDMGRRSRLRDQRASHGSRSSCQSPHRASSRHLRSSDFQHSLAHLRSLTLVMSAMPVCIGLRHPYSPSCSLVGEIDCPHLLVEFVACDTRQQLRCSEAGSDEVLFHLALSASHRLCLGTKTGKTSLWIVCNTSAVPPNFPVWASTLPQASHFQQAATAQPPRGTTCCHSWLPACSMLPGTPSRRRHGLTAHQLWVLVKREGKGLHLPYNVQPTAAMTCHIASGSLQPCVGSLQRRGWGGKRT